MWSQQPGAAEKTDPASQSSYWAVADRAEKPSREANSAALDTAGVLVAAGKQDDARDRQESVTIRPPSRGGDLQAQNAVRPSPSRSPVSNLIVIPSGPRPAPATGGRRALGEPIISNDPGIGAFVDGVFVARAQGSLLNASDTARVEVRRGPQGTLLGRNTIGGAVNFVTQKPSFDFGGNASVRVGTFDLLETKFNLNVPLIPERLATRIGVATQSRDGFSKNRFVGGDSTAGKDRAIAGRIQMLWNAADSFELLWSADASYEPRVLASAKCKFVGFGAARRSGTPGESSGGRRPGVVAATSGLPAPTTLAERDRLIALAKQSAADGGPFADACRGDDARGNFDISADSPLEDTVMNVGSTLVGTWTPSENLSLKSTTALRNIANQRANDGDGTGLPLSGSFRTGKTDLENKLFSQELTLSGNAQSNRLQWTAGVYGIEERNEANTRNQTFAGTTKQPAFVFAQGRNAEENLRNGAQVGTDPSAQDPALRALLMMNPGFTPKPVVGPTLTTGFGECVRVPGDTDADVAVSCLRPFVSSQSGNVTINDSQSYAGYGEASYSLTDALTLSAGLRYTSERKRVFRFGKILDVRDFSQQTDPMTQINGLDGNPMNGGRFVNDALLTTTNGRFTDFEIVERSGGYTPRFTAQYRFTDALSAYTTFSRGFVPARFNGQLFLSPTMSPFTDPETVTQYEVGINSRWLGGKFVLNAAYYTNLYRDIQRTVTTNDDTGTLVSLTSNVGKAVINGGEVDVALMPLARLMLTSSIAVKAGRYQEFKVLPTQPSFKDAGLPGVTPLTMDFAVNYSLPVGVIGDLRTRVNWRHEATTPSIVADPSFSRIPKHGTLGGMFTLDFKDGVTSVALFGTNLLDREYFTNVIDFSGSNGSAQYFFAPPRQYGLEIRRKF